MFGVGVGASYSIGDEVWVASAPFSPNRRKSCASLRGWRNTVEIVPFEISNSMKSFLSVVHAYTSTLRPPTVFRQPLNVSGSSQLLGVRSQNRRESVGSRILRHAAPARCFFAEESKTNRPMYAVEDVWTHVWRSTS